jgi:hypothetical protein
VHRRRYLAALGTLAVGGVAGCSALGDADDAADGPEATGTEGTTAAPRTTARPPADPISIPVEESELDRAAPRDAIPAITDPVFGDDWSGVEYEIQRDSGAVTERPRLSFEDEVLGVIRDGRARAYPLKLLDWHEVVNDEFGGPLAVTYCPVCDSGLVAERVVDGEPTTFGVSGYLYRANLVMYDDATDSLWSQLAATAIRGPAAGTELSLYPSTVTSWGRWQAENGDTEVLLPPPISDTVLGGVRYDYDLDLYGRKRRIAERYPDYGPLGSLEWTDERLRRRTPVLGVAHGDEAVAYPARAVAAEGPIEDRVGGRPIVVASGPDDSLVAYDRRVDGETLSFADAQRDWHLAAGGSTWQVVDGEAADGPHAGERLTRVDGARQLYWAAWLQFNPETTVFGVEG